MSEETAVSGVGPARSRSAANAPRSARVFCFCVWDSSTATARFSASLNRVSSAATDDNELAGCVSSKPPSFLSSTMVAMTFRIKPLNCTSASSASSLVRAFRAVANRSADRLTSRVPSHSSKAATTSRFFGEKSTSPCVISSRVCRKLSIKISSCSKTSSAPSAFVRACENLAAIFSSQTRTVSTPLHTSALTADASPPWVRLCFNAIKSRCIFSWYPRTRVLARVVHSKSRSKSLAAPAAALATAIARSRSATSSSLGCVVENCAVWSTKCLEGVSSKTDDSGRSTYKDPIARRDVPPVSAVEDSD